MNVHIVNAVPGVAAAPSDSRRFVAGVVVGATAAQVTSAMSIAVFPVIAPQLAPLLAVDASLVGYLMSLLFGSAMAASPLVGTAVLRWGACRSMQVATALSVCGMALAMSGQLFSVVVAALLVGASAALVAAGAAHLLFRFSSPARRNLIFSIKQTGVPLGWAMIALLAPGITLAFGWRWSLAVIMLYGVAVLFFLQRVRVRWDDDRNPQGAAQLHLLAGVRLLWRFPALRRLACAAFFFSFVQLCLGTFTVTLLVKEAGYTLVAAGFMFSLLQIAGMSGRLLLGWVADATGRSVTVLAASDLVVAACCVMTAFVNSAWPPTLLAALYGVFGAMAYGWNGILHAQIARLSPKGMVSVATGGLMVWIFAGTLSGPALFAFGYRFVGSYTACFGALALVAFAGWLLLRPAQGADVEPEAM